MWRAWSPTVQSGPPILPLLQGLSGLAQAPLAALQALAGLFQAQPFRTGDVFWLQAEAGDWAFLLASGTVEILRHVHGQKAEVLAQLGTGALVGINALIDQGPRTASCVAVGEGWIYKITQEQLIHPPNAVATWWKDCLLINLTAQLKIADACLAQLPNAGAALPLKAFYDFGHQVAHPPETPEIPPIPVEQVEDPMPTHLLIFQDDIPEDPKPAPEVVSPPSQTAQRLTALFRKASLGQVKPTYFRCCGG